MIETVTLREESGMGRFLLRMDAKYCSALRSAPPFALDMPMNRCARSGARISARLGPDEWILLLPEQEVPSAYDQLSAAMPESWFSLVDISARHRAFVVSGPHATDVINAGCPLDLDEHVFPVGHASRTVLGHAEIILMHVDPGVFHLECGRSFGPYLRAFLEDAASEQVI